MAIAPKASGPKPLKGPDKVAVLLMTMGKPLASRVMRHFDPDDLTVVSRSIAELRPVPTAQVESLIEDFASQFVSGANLVGTASDVERLLDGVLPPDQISAIMADVIGNAGATVWDRISTVSETVLAGYVIKEHPQTAALVLSKVKPACAAKVMSHLPPNLRNSVMRRMLSFKPIVDETLRILERTLHEDLMVNFQRNMGADTHARVADIINKMDRDHMENVLENLSSTRPKSAEILKGLLFTFDDIVTLSPKSRTSLFDKVPTDRLSLALKGTDADFRDIILQSLGSRVRRMVEQELSTNQSASQKEVMEARRTITDLALEMAGRGEIEINSESEDDAFIR